MVLEGISGAYTYSIIRRLAYYRQVGGASVHYKLGISIDRLGLLEMWYDKP